MAERYSRLYHLPEGLYTPGAPLVIAAGALLTDSQSGQIIAQLKMRSISSKTINTVKVLVTGLDSAGRPICQEEHVYAGLNAARDTLFGAKEGVRLYAPGVRSFSARVLTVAFSDGSRYIDNGGEWKPLPQQINLNQRLFDTELIRQYRMETSEESRFVPLEVQDLWLCACGEINHRGESCCRCGQTLSHCKECMNVERLRENKSLRLNAQAVQAALNAEKMQARGRVLQRVLLVLVPILLIAAITLGVYKLAQRRTAIYDEAYRLYRAGEYADAAVLFGKTLHYRDSDEMEAKAKKADAEIASYNRASVLFDNERWDDAYEAFKELGSFQDSAERAQEARYRKGLSLLESADYAEAREIFRELGDFRDAPAIAAHFFNRLLSEEASLNLECNGPLTTSYVYDNYGRIAEKTEHFSAYSGMSDRVYVYSYGGDGSYSVSEGQVEKLYDPYGAYLGQGNVISYVYDYEFYPDGSVHYRIGRDAKTKEYRSSAAYDEHGNLIGVQDEDGPTYTLLNEYDGDRLTKQERYNEDGTMLTRTSFEYDENGMLKRAVFLTPGASSTVTILYTNGPVFAMLATE